MFDFFNSFSQEKFDVDSGKQFHNAIFANGIFQLRKAPMGTFVVKVEDKDFSKYGLTQKCEQSFTFDHVSIPKIPVGVLSEVITLYSAISKTIKSEVYCAIIWDKIKKDFFIHVPTQEVSAATIKYTNTEEIYNNPNLVVLMDIHSHVNMNAFFSGTDLADEVGTRFYGVIGKIDSPTPEMVCRAATNGIGITLEYDQIFDVDKEKLYETSDYTVPQEDYANIVEFKWSAPVTQFKGKTSKWDDWEDGYYGGYNTGYNSKTKTTPPPAATTTYNPFTSIYTQISTMRYGKHFVKKSIMEFLTTSVECAARYLEENDASATEIYSVMQEFDTIATNRFNSIVDQTDYVISTTETEFSPSTTTGLTTNDNSSKTTANV